MEWKRKRRKADPAWAAKQAEYEAKYRRESGQSSQAAYRERNRDLLRAVGREQARIKRTDPAYRLRQAEISRRYWRALKLEMIAAYGGCCSCCGEDAEAFLTLEHLNNDGNAHRARVGTSNVWVDLKRRGWPRDDYTVLCFNCNLGKRCNGGVCPHQVSVSTLTSL